MTYYVIARGSVESQHIGNFDPNYKTIFCFVNRRKCLVNRLANLITLSKMQYSSIDIICWYSEQAKKRKRLAKKPSPLWFWASDISFLRVLIVLTSYEPIMLNWCSIKLKKFDSTPNATSQYGLNIELKKVVYDVSTKNHNKMHSLYLQDRIS